MGNRKQMDCEILSQSEIAPGIFDMWIRFPDAGESVPGQFVNIYTDNDAKILPRPISICERGAEALRLVYRVTGKDTGTEEFSKKRPGDAIKVLGPLGNGYTDRKGKALLLGGGVGVPPMLELFKSLPGEKTAVMGYRDGNTFLRPDFEAVGRTFIATEDGSCGTKGNVLDAVRKEKLTADVIYACGPLPMLKAVKRYAEEIAAKCYISLEERMACGVGACLGCVCKTKKTDAHSNGHTKRVCQDGPVFDAEEVEI